ncbi:MAG: hypothetical protein M1820_001258 [Bogoriella megaspora]|nr:MAG: hypothetical protein M1820_001258 [Bogoriella megaspora]
MAYNGYYGNYNSSSNTSDYQRSNYANHDQHRSQSSSGNTYQQASLPAVTQAAQNYQSYQPQTYSSAWYGSTTSTANANHDNAAEVLTRLGNYNQSRPSAHTGQTSNTSGHHNNSTLISPGYSPGINTSLASPGVANAPNSHGNFQTGTTTAPPTSSHLTYQNSRQGHGSAHSQQPRPRSVNSVASDTAHQPRQSPKPDASSNMRSNYVYNANTSGQNQPNRMQAGSTSNIRSNSPYNAQSSIGGSAPQRTGATPSHGQRREQRPAANLSSHSNYGSARESHSVQTRMTQQLTSYDQYQQSATGQAYESSPDLSAPVTVDPSQVYDPFAENQRRRALEIEQERIAEARRAEAKQAEEAKKAEEARQAEEAEKARQAQEQLQREQAGREQAAAMAAAMSSLSAGNESGSGSGDGDLEAQMKAMFLKMREFHAKDPGLLAKIWEQERSTHQHSSQQSPKPTSPTRERKGTNPQKPTVSVSAVQPNTSRPLANQASPVTNNRKSITARQHQQQQSAKPPPTPAEQEPSQAPAVKPPPLKPQKAQTGTVWPQNKKKQLAEAAANWINAVPANAKDPITPDQLIGLLDANPSYIELCESLENRQLKIDRAAFARALLTAVPEVNNAPRQQVQRPIQPPPTPASSSGPSKHTPKEPSSTKNKRQASSSAQKATTTPHSAYANTNNGSSPYFVSTPGGARHAPSASGDRPSTARSSVSHSRAPVAKMVPGRESSQRSQTPATKEEAARKRSFADIVDLTAGMSDDDDGDIVIQNVNKQPRLGQTFGLSLGQPSVLVQPSAQNAPPRPLAPAQNIAPPQPTKPVQLDDARSKLITADNIIKPLDKAKALRKSTYNPKTIARDILLATGRHAEMYALNAHLEGLQKFKMVDATSDLSTFRWDLVDPGDPILPVQSAGVDQGTEADDEGDEDGDHRARPQVVIRRQIINPATGDVSTVEERISAPRSDSRKKSVMKKRIGRPRSDGLGIRQYTYNNGEANTTPAGPQRINAAGSNTEPTRRPLPGDSGSRVGSNSAAGPSSRPGSYNGSTYAAFRQTMAANGTPLPKKRGRPVGWRKHIHGTTTTRDSNAAAPPAPPDPEYPVFKCQWKDCSGKLHNLDTLRKHIKMLHGDVDKDEKWRCRWKSCTKVTTNFDKVLGEEDTQPQPFDSQEEWMQHMEKEHISPIAWKLGDGPTAGLSDAHDSEASEAYLSDAQGRRVTPRISAPPPSNETPPPPIAGPSSAPSSGGQGLKRRGRPPGSGQQSLRDQAIEAQNTLDRKKRQIGPGLDRGGSILANEKRRQGFVEDEDDQGILVNDEDV